MEGGAGSNNGGHVADEFLSPNSKALTWNDLIEEDEKAQQDQHNQTGGTPGGSDRLNPAPEVEPDKMEDISSTNKRKAEDLSSDEEYQIGRAHV